MRITMKCCCLLLFSLPSRATDFVNLDFDDPNLTNLAFYNTPPFGERRLYGPILDLLRGWSVTEGGKPYSGLMAYSVAPDGGGGISERPNGACSGHLYNRKI